MVTFGRALDGVPSLFSVAFDLGSVGYAVDEHFATGTATAYRASRPRESDGRWAVTPSATAEFSTRVVVHRPTDPARGNGTVIVEWLNVTGGLDIPALWMPTHRHLVRDGYTWVGVSAQQVGIEGGGMMPGLGLHQMAPERYGSLHHPGDRYAFDMFTRIGRAIPELLSTRYGVRVERMIAAGASQSAFYLTTYVNAIDPHNGAFDAFLLQGRAGAGAPFEGWDPASVGPNVDVARRARLAGDDRIRDDLRVPVLVVQSETDVLGMLAYLPARQADNERFRLWEIAGAAHCDTYFLYASPLDSGSIPIEELAELIARTDRSGAPAALPINSGPQMHYVLQRAFDALNRWIDTGLPPPTAPRLEIDNGTLVVDDAGVARGGVRTPWVDAPSTVLSGLGQPADMTELFGTTRPLSSRTLADRYPRGRNDYLAQFRDATHAAVNAGFLLEADAAEIETLGVLAWPNT
jgi:hypothetical protein